ncbi:MAG TPA: DNA-processing protein DprA [Candidatus Limnocylindrales bacterium]|nr:DNA-processing protein DprA [Candidatus Limnocylindrales bacterium]
MTSDSAPIEILLRLSLVEGVTARHLRLLRMADRTPPLPRASGDAGQSIFRRAIEALTSREAGERATRILETCGKAGIRMIPLGSGDYPAALRPIPDAPLVLYRAGGGVPWENSVAVVGSRAPTTPGLEFAGELASDLGAAGWTVVSGMARGIDPAAHEGALRGGGKTAAVLGCGVDVVYPPEAGRLRSRILEQGALLSEYPPGILPLPRHFPARNRIISGISRGVVVVEAPSRSGALITAQLALDQGREVMAVPGNPLFPHTAGSNRLLREGAAPVTGAGDVIEALGWTCRIAAGESRERRILGFLSRPRHVGEIAEVLGIPPPELLPCLLEMEFMKLLERSAGDYYKKMSSR